MMETDNRLKTFFLVGETIEEAKAGLIHDSYDSADNYLRNELDGEGEVYTVLATVHFHTAETYF